MAGVIVIGLDGVDPELLKRWEDSLPHLRALRDEGAYAELNSTIPPLSSPAWPSFATGRHPGEIGFYGFNRRVEDSYTRETVNFSHWQRIPNLWNILNAEGFSTGVLSLPVTYPPEEVDGFMVVNMPAPLDASDITYPPELKEELDRVVDGYEIETPKSNRDTPDSVMFEERMRVMEKQQQAARYLQSEKDSDVFLYVISAPDRVGHHYWKYFDTDHPQYQEDAELEDALKDTYMRADRYVGELLEQVDEETTVIVLSDHGFGPKHGVFYLNQWLEEQGYLGRGEQTTASLFERVGVTKENIMRILRRFNIESVKDRLPTFMRGAAASLPEREGVVAIEAANIQWSETEAFSLDSHCLWLNMEGREPEGSVSREEYDALRAEIAERLESLKHPVTGDELDVTVQNGEDVYGGEKFDNTPDLVITIEGMLWDVGTAFPGEIFDADPSENGDHRQHGIFMAKGPQLKAGERIPTIDITDVAPTILHLLDCPVDAGMTGSPRTDIFSSGSIRDREVEEKEFDKAGEGFSWSEDQEDAVKERLRGLGYLE